IKPDVVLYEEGHDQNILSGAIRAISEEDVLIVGGTSLAVYPAAGLLDYYNGHKLVLVNKTPTARDGIADLVVQGSIGEIFSQL
ncbi:MAG: NAD-dependent protein deacylase, partial [Lachnospiraceae bacterium]|nr:NAD-dependent protein deacylase [Lachnospiraceae bacterium]